MREGPGYFGHHGKEGPRKIVPKRGYSFGNAIPEWIVTIIQMAARRPENQPQQIDPIRSGCRNGGKTQSDLRPGPDVQIHQIADGTSSRRNELLQRADDLHDDGGAGVHER